MTDHEEILQQYVDEYNAYSLTINMIGTVWSLTLESPDRGWTQLEPLWWRGRQLSLEHLHYSNGVAERSVGTPDKCRQKTQPDAQPVQTPAQVMNEERLLFLKQWLEGKINEEIAKPAFVDAGLSPIHVVAKLDKSYNRIPGKYRVALDCSRINNQFGQYPCAIASSPLTAARLAQYDVKAVIDISDGFFGIKIPEEEEEYFGFVCQFGVYMFERIPPQPFNSWW